MGGASLFMAHSRVIPSRPDQSLRRAGAGEEPVLPSVALGREANASSSSSHISLCWWGRDTHSRFLLSIYTRGTHFSISRALRHLLGHVVLVDGLIHLKVKSHVVFSPAPCISTMSAQPVLCPAYCSWPGVRMTNLSWYARIFHIFALKFPGPRNSLSLKQGDFPFQSWAVWTQIATQIQLF